MIDQPERVPEHESPLRHMMAEASGQQFHALSSLEEAQEFEDGVVIFEGDYGGQIYVTSPARMVGCSFEALQRLLREIDSKCWDDETGAKICFERLPIGAGVAGGMGGGMVVAGVWLHDRIEQMGLRPQIETVLAGKPAQV